MEICSLKLLNFRNYENLSLTFSKNTNIIYGLNGVGKTNILEAIYMLGLTKTFRLGSDDVVIKKGKTIAKIEGLVHDEITNNYKIIISEEGKQIKVDNNKVIRLSDYITKINIVLFNPDDLKIIKDTPSTRRKLLNIEISGMNSEYIVQLNNFNKILKQRNSYLKALNKKNCINLDYLNILTEQLIDVGLKIVSLRKEFLNDINCYIGSIYTKITAKGDLSVVYKSEYLNKTKDQLLKIYQKQVEREIFMGKTLIGPQHDDLEFMISGSLVKEYSSVGEQKNSVIAFKLATIKIIEEKLHKKPILLLDDLFSEIDQEKINHILSLIDERLQTIITTTSIANVDAKLLKKAKIFHIENGTIREEFVNG